MSAVFGMVLRKKSFTLIRRKVAISYVSVSNLVRFLICVQLATIYIFVIIHICYDYRNKIDELWALHA